MTQQLRIHAMLSAGDADGEELERYAQALRAELDDVEAVRVEPGVAAAPPEGAKSVSATDWANLLITLASSGGVAAVLTILRDWLRRNRDCTIKLRVGDGELELTGAAPELQKEAMEALVKRNGGGGGT